MVSLTAASGNHQRSPAVSRQRVTILGSTGSIGENTLDVIARHPQRYEVFALTANTRVDLLLPQLQQHSPRYAVLRDEQAAEQLRSQLKSHNLEHIDVLAGESGLNQVVVDAQVDTVMAAIVGAAGLGATMAAAEAGKKILLANKESLVMAGDLFMAAVERSGAVLLPIDSEHNAIFQCMPHDCQQRNSGNHQASSLAAAGVSKILLTGSGGPFRQLPLEQLGQVTPAQACAHPNWVMGQKISVDSATMMNKGLELIEACWLFACKPQQIDIVVHPQSVIHSMVQYVDGSVLAQLGNPDMRTPIAHALAFPERIDAGVAALDLIAIGQLDFEQPDLQRFPCLRLAMDAVALGGSAMTVLNAANEVAVEAFLQGRIRFTDIAVIIEQLLGRHKNLEPDSISTVQGVDSEARHSAEQLMLALVK